MIQALAILLSCQLVGEIAVRGVNLTMPGPVLGLVILFVALMAADRIGRTTPDTIEATDLGRTAGALLASLGILFVPAGVGVVQQTTVLGTHAGALLVALVVSTILTLIVTVWVFLLVARRTGAGE